MPRSTQLICDLATLAKTDFTPESVAKSQQRFGGDHKLTKLAAMAQLQAAQLKTSLMEMQRAMDPADPSLAIVNSILEILD